MATLQRDHEVERLYQSALEHHQNGRLADAERLYRSALSCNPGHVPSLHHLGVLAHQAGQDRAALELIDGALERAPAYAEAHCNRGLVLLAMQKADEAALAFRTAIGLEPTYIEAHYNLGVACDARELPGDALACYEHVLQLAPDHADARCNRAIALQALGRLDEAIIAYRETLALAPQLTRLQTYYGRALLEQGATAAGDEALQRAMALSPDDPAPPYFLSEVRLRAGDYLGAITLLQDALRRLIANGALTMPAAPQPKGSRSIGQFPQALRAVMACMQNAGIEVYLTSGTLLGAIRDGDFIGFDKDIDFGVSADVPIADIHRALGADPDFTTDASQDETRTIYWTRWRDVIAVDFFRFYNDESRCWYEFSCGGQWMKWVHRPFGLKDIIWHGTTVRIPENSEWFLEEVYGRNWRIPDPDWPQWASPNLEGGFSDTYRAMAHNDMFVALWQGHKTRARNQCQHALQLAPGDPFFRELMKSLVETES